jgi:dTDP-4-dehydrorhamnose 3,5-epimerase
MRSLAERGVSPTVVDDQVGRLTFADELARATRHLLEHGEPGTYHVTNSGPATSWAEVATEVFRVSGREPADVTGTSTADYFADRPGTAPRPLNSVLDLTRLEATGFVPRDAFDQLRDYLGS